MTEQQLTKIKIYFTGTITLIMLALLMWQYFHNGVPSHHLLHNADYPAISNWWGLLVLPALSWLLLERVHKQTLTKSDQEIKYPTNRLVGFGLALLYGAGMSIAFATGNTEISSVMFPGILVIALFFKVYREEYILGFILSMSIVFGAVLPTIFATIIAIGSAIVYHCVHFIIRQFKVFFKNTRAIN
ncbi:hypothetical protein [Thalassomonas sp. M1454]|uniref:hypothetical protein n=1 Tax=Thalassomonas sp. M1454 TaxID=2594477 RepID=UPI001180F090|nr:hypothetical protein [Thalassomonas sp. M1454]TRX53397.1 hypothetical protein FNN08_14080 [Thalassomonas sp. M1454]